MGISIRILEIYAGPSQAGGRGACAPPHFLVDQLTLSQPGGGIFTCPPGFSDLATALLCFALVEIPTYQKGKCNPFLMKQLSLMVNPF